MRCRVRAFWAFRMVGFALMPLLLPRENPRQGLCEACGEASYANAYTLLVVAPPSNLSNGETVLDVSICGTTNRARGVDHEAASVSNWRRSATRSSFIIGV